MTSARLEWVAICFRLINFSYHEDRGVTYEAPTGLTMFERP